MSPPTAAPERSLDQRMEALRRANVIRSKRAALKRDVKAGRRSIVQLLLEPPDYLETAKVFDLLMAAPKYGRVKVNKVLQLSRISPSKTVGGMSQRQRLEVAGRFGAPADAIARHVELRPRTRGEKPKRDPLAPTDFQREVLELADRFGSADVAYLDDIARALNTSPQHVAHARRVLQELGLLDVWSDLSDSGRQYLAATTTPAALAA